MHIPTLVSDKKCPKLTHPSKYDSAEVSNWVDPYLLNKLETTILKIQVGLYRDYGWINSCVSFRETNGQNKKRSNTIFLYKSLKITVDMKIETTNILHVNLNLVTEEYKTFIKDDNQNTST